MKSITQIAIDRAIKKASGRNLTQKDERVIRFRGEEIKLPIIREFEPRRFTLCVPSQCNAREDCCHKTTVDGIDLCYYSESSYILRDKRGSWLKECHSYSDENKYWEDIGRFKTALEIELEGEK